MKTKPRYGATIDLIVLHDPEGANTARELYNYLQHEDAGYHAMNDDHELIVAAGDDLVVEGAGGVNTRSLNLCFVPGFAAWTRDQWLVHTPALKLGASWIAAKCKEHGIPVVHLSAQQVATPGIKGICTHGDVTAAGYTQSEGHTDPGPNFPMDVLLAFVNGQSPPVPGVKEEPMWVPGPHKPVAGMPPGPAAGWFPNAPDVVVLVSGQSIKGDRPGPNGTRLWDIPLTGGAHGHGIYPYGVSMTHPLGSGIVARDTNNGAHIGSWS